MEKIASVKRVQVFVDQQEAVVELDNAAVGALQWTLLQYANSAIGSREAFAKT